MAVRRSDGEHVSLAAKRWRARKPGGVEMRNVIESDDLTALIVMAKLEEIL